MIQATKMILIGKITRLQMCTNWETCKEMRSFNEFRVKLQIVSNLIKYLINSLIHKINIISLPHVMT